MPAGRRERARARGELFGIGLSTFIEPSAGDWESGQVRVEPDGTVVAASGSSAQGQGHLTAFAQVVADRLQVPVNRVTVLQGDTSTAPPGIGTFGSRSAALGGSALANAADRVLTKMRTIAGHLLEVSVDDVSYAAGVFRPVGVATRGLGFAEVAAAACDPQRLPPGLEPGLDVAEHFEEPLELYSHGAHVAAVGIDPETGRVHLHTLIAVDDAGVLINPLLAEGQVMGGLAQGTGQALLEHMTYTQDGTVLTGSLGDYAVPRSTCVPTWVLGETETPTPLNPLGVKGVGEGGAVGAPPAIVNAVLDALRPLGIRHLDMPLTPERVWAALNDGGVAREQGSSESPEL
jgi:aerobic carbon-monoxide dehydrogenase large subunit